MKIPYYKAIDKDTDLEVRGFYFEYPRTTYCFTEDYNKSENNLIPCLMSWRMIDWGLPNEPTICRNIDKATLEQIGWIDTDNDYFNPNNWLEETK